MRDLIEKWRAAGAEWNPVSPVGIAYAECARDLEAAMYESTRRVGSTDNGFRSAPARYTKQERETIDRIRDAMTDAGFVAFCLGTAMRYEDRAGAKGDAEGDAEKARWYRQMIAHVNGDGPDPRAGRPGFQPYVRKGG